MPIKDGLGFEEVNQTTTSTATISGTNVYGATSVQSATISGTNIYAATDMQVAGKSVASASTGSPSTFGADVIYGTVTATDVAVWSVFGTAFTGSAIVNLTLAESGAAASHPGCVVEAGAGSFSMLGQSGLTYNYSAKQVI